MAEINRPFPLDSTRRTEVRTTARRFYLERAEVDAQLHGMSMNCRERSIHGTHPVKEPGCSNTGVGCLCWCHDRPTTEGAPDAR